MVQQSLGVAARITHQLGIELFQSIWQEISGEIPPSLLTILKYTLEMLRDNAAEPDFEQRLEYQQIQHKNRQFAAECIGRKEHLEALPFYQDMGTRALKQRDTGTFAEACRGLAQTNYSLGELQEAADCLRTLLVSLSGPLRESTQAREALLMLGDIYLSANKPDKASERLARLCDICQRIGDRHLELRTRYLLTIAYQRMGATSELVGNCTHEAELARELNERKQESETLGVLASTLKSTGDLEKALPAAERALEISVQEELEAFTAKVRGVLADLYQDLSDTRLEEGRFDDALHLCNKNLANARQLDNETYLGTALFDLGKVELHLGQWHSAFEHFEEQVEIAHKFERPDWESEGLIHAADALVKLGAGNSALEMYSKAIHLAEIGLNPYLRVRAQKSVIDLTPAVCMALLKQSKTEECVSLFETRLTLCRQMKDIGNEFTSLSLLGEVTSSSGSPNDAIRYFSEAVSLCQRHDQTDLLEQATDRLALQYFGVRQYEQAVETYTQSVVMFRASGNKEKLCVSLLNLAAGYNNTGRHTEAKDCFLEQIEVAREVGDRLREARGLVQLGMCCHELRDLTLALSSSEKARRISKELDEPQLQGLACVTLYNCNLALGNQNLAQAFAAEGADLLEPFDHPLGHAMRNAYKGERLAGAECETDDSPRQS